MATRTPLRPVKRRALPRRRVATTKSPPTASTFDREYWLAHCEGYRVDATEGRIGFVETVHTGGAKRGPILAIRAGRLGRHLLEISADDVAFIVPRAERIWLRSPVQILHSAPA